MASDAAGERLPGLQKDQFNVSVELVALRISPKQCAGFMARLSGHVLHRPKVKAIIAPPDANEREAKLLLLNEGVSDTSLTELPTELREYVLAEGAVAERHTLKLTYEHLTAEQVLRTLLPSGMEVPSAFEQIGHVAHVNLREEHLPYKATIGEVLLDKNAPRIRSVVNKVESISNEFRVFPMELLAGDPSLRTSVRENGAKFELDYSEVYWNSRLETEHKRVLELLPENGVIADGFAGIGPFAVPAAMRGCRVYANDLNPKSHEWLAVNVAGNKVANRVKTYNMDGRAFIQALLHPTAPMPDDGTGSGGAASETSTPALPMGPFSHVLMNLPASALTFLDAFVGAFDRATWQAPLPTVHCYCFSKAADPAADVIAIAEQTMGCTLVDPKVTVVRDVAPQKLMLCLSFQVPDAVAWSTTEEQADERSKRLRTE